MKDEYPPLLPLGFHMMTLGGLQTLCVEQFKRSVTRTMVFDGLTSVIDGLIACGIEMEVWIDGSFLTRKRDPEDSDVVARIAQEAWAAASDDERRVLAALVRRDLRREFRCDFYSFIEYEKGHKLEAQGEWMRAYWLRQFGFSRRDEPKGLAVIKIEAPRNTRLQ